MNLASTLSNVEHEANFKIYPLVNTDGYDFAKTSDPAWIKNRNFENCPVNLERNWDFHHEITECSDIKYGGQKAESEAEIKDLIADIKKTTSIRAIIEVKGGADLLSIPVAVNKNHVFRKMEHRLRKSWETQNIERKLFSDQTGRASNWAISNGYDYAAEVQTLSLEKLSNFIQSLSKILKNEDEIVWNSIDSYVWADDGFYEFEEIDQKTRDGYTVYFLHMTSQKWLNETILDHIIWKHELHIIVPDTVNYNASAMFLHITNKDNPLGPIGREHSDTQKTAKFAVATETISAVLYQTPNQPIKFVERIEGEIIYPSGRYEDGIIGRCWRMFIDNYNNGVIDHNVLVQNAMAKGGVRALDTITEFIYEKTGHYLLQAGVTGASKRGWTTWLTAAVDYERVSFMAPVYFDELNMVENIHHHYRAMGAGYTYAFLDYYLAGVTEYLDSEAIQASLSVMDVLTFKDRYAKHQLNYIINAGNDEFFMLGNPHYFFDQLSEKTLLRVIPNQGHGGVGGDGRTQFPKMKQNLKEMDGLWRSLEGLFMAHLHAPELIPILKTVIEDRSDASQISVQSSKTAKQAYRWETNSMPGRRDFRAAKLQGDEDAIDRVCGIQDAIQAIQDGLKWYENPNDYISTRIGQNTVGEEINIEANNQSPNPIKNFVWKGGFIELEFDLLGREFKATTIPAIVPAGIWPAEDCFTPEDCRGCLV